MRILILGPQGSGKGTQAKRIAAVYDAPHVATGDMFRAAVAEASELGKRVAPILEEGRLVPDDLTIELIRERLAEEDAFVLDGFPRTVAQAEALEQGLAARGRKLDAAVLIDVPDDEVVGRLALRGREDDRPEVVRERLRVYHDATEPLIGYYGDRGLLERVDGTGEPEAVQDRLREAVDGR